VMTAVFAGILILSGAMWSYRQLQAYNPPIVGYSMPLSRVEGSVSPGTTVDLYKGQEKVGTAVVEMFNLGEDGKSGISKVNTATFNKGRIAEDVDRMRVGTADAPTFSGSVASRDRMYLFPRVYLQGGVATAIILIGAFFLYRFAASKPNTVDFLIATDGEMKKVNWSTRQIIKDSTIVVIGATFLIGGYIFICDTILWKTVQLLHIVET